LWKIASFTTINSTQGIWSSSEKYNTVDTAYILKDNVIMSANKANRYDAYAIRKF
jgi:hypothetical protein